MRKLIKNIVPQVAHPSRSTAPTPRNKGDLGDSTTSSAIKILDIGVGQSKGLRPYQEDRYKIIRPGSEYGHSVALFAIYDGHGGDNVSTFVEQHLHHILFDQLQHQHGRDAFDEAIAKSFQEVDRRLRKNGIGATVGSTVSLALVDLVKGTMVTADLGDSYAFFGVLRDDAETEVFKLSLVQSPSERMERERIERAGGKVQHDMDTTRIGGVNMSRALGDLKYKVPLPDKAAAQDTLDPLFNISESASSNTAGQVMLADWISNVPHTNYKSLCGGRRQILLLASDGLGEEKDGPSSLMWVSRRWEKVDDATHLARQLAEESSKRTGDNSTVVIVVFG